jgi:hypothetical protein
LPAGRVCSVEEADRKLPPAPNEATKRRLSLAGRGRRAAPGEGRCCRRATSEGPRRLSSGPAPGSADSIAVDRPATVVHTSRMCRNAATVRAADPNGRHTGSPPHCPPVGCRIVCATSVSAGPRARRRRALPFLRDEQPVAAGLAPARATRGQVGLPSRASKFTPWRERPTTQNGRTGKLLRKAPGWRVSQESCQTSEQSAIGLRGDDRRLRNPGRGLPFG